MDIFGPFFFRLDEKIMKNIFPNEFLRCLGVSPVHLRHSRVFLRVPSVSIRAHTPPSARLGWTPPLPGCTGWRHDKKSEKHEKSRNFVIFHVFLECFCGVSGVLPARLRHCRVPLCAPIREHTRLDLRYSDNYLVLSKQ